MRSRSYEALCGDCGVHEGLPRLPAQHSTARASIPVRSPTRYFVLRGIIVHETKWKNALTQLIDFRLRMRSRFGLLMKEEIHTGAMLTRPSGLVRIRKNDRLTIVRQFLDQIAAIADLRIISVCIDKQGKADRPLEQLLWT